MSADNYAYLFYDKATGDAEHADHTYSNKLTNNITMEELFTSDYKIVKNKKALEKIKKFGENYEIKEKMDFSLYEIYLFCFSMKGVKTKVTVVAINKEELEKLVTKKKKIPNKEFLILLCTYHAMYEKGAKGIYMLDKTNAMSKISEACKTITKTAMIPNADQTDPIEEQPSFATEQLYDYQKKTIRWMIDREKESTGIYYNLNDETIIGNVAYDIILQDFTLANDRKKLVFSGGALIDEVGLGKTYQMIMLALCNQAKNISYFQKKYNMLFSKATLVVCPNQLGCQWIRELEKMVNKKYGLNVIPFFTKTHYDKYTYQDLLDADFVVVSFNFLKNQCFLKDWINKLSQQKTYLTSARYSHNDALKVINSLGAELKKNTSCINELCPNILLIHWHRIVVDEFHEIFTKSEMSYVGKLLKLFKGDYKWCMTATPFDSESDCLISMADFVTNYANDAGTNIFMNKEICDYINTKFFRRNTKASIVNEYKLPPLNENVVLLNFSQTEWMMYNAYLSNPNVDKFSVLVRQICCHPKIADEIKSSLSNCKTLQDIEKMMVTLYKKQMDSAASKVRYFEYRILRLKRKIKILEWKRQKKYLKQLKYKVSVDFEDNTIDAEEIKKLEKQLENDPDVAGMFIGNEKDDDPFDSDSDSDDEKYTKEITISDKNQDKIMNLIGKKLKDNPSSAIEGLQDTEKNFEQKLEVAKKDHNGKKSTHDYYNDVMKKLKETSKKLGTDDSDSDSDDESNQKCGVCLGSIKGHDLGVTKCGHIFCYNCVKPFVEKQNKCPMCQRPVKYSEIYMIAEPVKEEKNDKDLKDKESLINKVGTKLANLIFYLKKNNEHSIIFSQWDDLLKKVADVLDDYGIKNVFCKGNVWQRNKAIKEFTNNDKIKVIMLSSESAASGTNLTKAKTVILLDPVYGSYEYRRNTEWQAIGRAYRMGQVNKVNVVRFVVRGTVEEEIYNMNKSEDKKNDANKKIFEITDDTIKLEKEKIEEIVDASKHAKPKKVKAKKLTAKELKEQKLLELKKLDDLSEEDYSSDDF